MDDRVDSGTTSKKCFGRDAVGWYQLTLFYVALYAFLAAFFASLLTILVRTLPKESPRYYGNNSLLLANPGIAVRPKKDIDSSVLLIDTSDTTNWIAYKEQVDYFVDKFGGNYATDRCDSDLPLLECYADLRWLFQDPNNLNCGTNYGYDSGEPCIILKFNRIYGYTAEAYDSITNLAKATAPHEKYWTAWKAGHIGVICYGIDALHSEFIERMSFFPPGFNTRVVNTALSGYETADGSTIYIPPTIGLKIKLRKTYTLAQIECKLLAPNIYNRGNEKTRHGIVRFEVMVQTAVKNVLI